MSYRSLFVLLVLFAFGGSVARAGGQSYTGDEDPNKKVLKQGLVGAGVGAISAEASGGKAGTGALVGAGTNVLGNALVDTLTAPSPRAAQPMYGPPPAQTQYTPASAYPVQTVQTQAARPVEPAPVYVQQQPAYYAPPREDPSKRILRQGLVGAGVGAVSASASGGKAGKGALIGAGTNILGSALLDSLSGPSQPQPQPVYYTQPVSAQPQQRKIIRHYDAQGNIVSEEEVLT